MSRASRDFSVYRALQSNRFLSREVGEAMQNRLPRFVWACWPRSASFPYPLTQPLINPVSLTASEALLWTCGSVSRTIGYASRGPTPAYPFRLVRVEPHKWLNAFENGSGRWVFEIGPSDPIEEWRFDLNRRRGGDQALLDWANLTIQWVDPVPPEAQDYV